MAGRPSTARSEISSAISDDGDRSRPQSGINPLPPPLPQQGYIHLRGFNHNAARSLRSPPPGAASTTTGSSRATSPVSQSTRTHVPSLTAQGFFRPMSSQRLQAQRLGRSHNGTPVPPPVEDTDEGAEPDTRSLSSSRQGPYVSMPQRYRTAPSINTDYSEADTRGNSFEVRLHNNATPRLFPQGTSSVDGNGSNGLPNMHHTPPHLNLSAQTTQFRGQEPQRSPMSFRSGFSLGSKRYKHESGHQHLSSTTTSPRYTIAEAAVPMKGESLGNNYEYFEGNTYFWWGGRIQNARDRPVNVATGILLILPAILFFVYSAPFLWHHVSPALPIIFAYLFFICISSFIHASLVDPGIFPRNTHPFPPEDEKDDPLALGPPMNDWVMIRLATSETAAMDVPVKYCKTCNIWRPPRCYHCRVCDNCVETLDHHCVWLNNCVGRRNYRYFFTFVASGTFVSLYLAFASLGHCLAYKSQHSVSFGRAINENRVPFAMFIYGILGCPYPGSLWFYHLFLMGKGETTREYLNSHKFVKADRHLPFTQGNIFKNWIAVLGRTRPPTYLQFKKKYEEGDQRFGLRKDRRQALLGTGAQGGGMEMKPVQKSFEGPHGRIANAA